METVESWAVQYRPKLFSDIIGQEKAVTMLKGSLARKRIPSALFIHGPSGTGKTTLGRMFAMYANCKTNDMCGTCASCTAVVHPDIAECNAATERGIDEMKALIAKTRFRPQHKVRVFIIDEAHQLTPQAMEAFLKPLEEPSKNTMFILCTTEPQKFKVTTIKRCLPVVLGLPPAESIAARLRVIAKAEKQRFPKALYMAAAEASGGCVRDAVNILETAANLIAGDENISEEDLISTISSVGDENTAANAGNILLGMYGNKPSLIVKAAFNTTDATQTINMALWFSEYTMAQALKFETRAVFHSPANREFYAAVRKQLPDAKLSTFLAAHKKLVEVRNTLHSVSTKETSLLIAMLT